MTKPSRKIDFIRAQFGDVICERLRKDATAAEALGCDMAAVDDAGLFAAFARAIDPTAGRRGAPYKYLHWAAQSFAAAPVMAEDIYKIRDDLADFDMWSARLGAAGLPNQITDLSGHAALTELLRPYQQQRDDKRAAQARRRMDEDARAVINAATTVIYDGPEGRVVVPHSKESSQYWGAQTRWCIAAQTSTNYFANYNADHPVVMYLPRVPAAERAAWQHSAFKLAAVGGHIYDEYDSSDPASLPPSINVLARAAWHAQDEDGRAWLEKHGQIRRIGATNTNAPLSGTSATQDGDAAVAAKEQDWKARLDALASEYSSEFSESTARRFERALQDVRHDLDFQRFAVGYCPRMAMTYRMPGFVKWLLPADSPLWAEEGVALQAVSYSLDFYKNLPRSLRGDRAFRMRAVAAAPHLLYRLGFFDRMNHDLVRQAVTVEGSVISAAGPRGDSWLVRAGSLFARVTGKARFLQDPRDNDELAALAIAQNGSAFAYISRRLRARKDIFESALAPLQDKSDRYNFRASTILSGASARIRKNKDYVRQIVAIAADGFQSAHPSLRRNKKFILEMIAQYPQISPHIAPRLLKSKRFIKQMLAVNPAVVYHSKELQKIMRYDPPLLKVMRENLCRIARYDENVLEGLNKSDIRIFHGDDADYKAILQDNPAALKFPPPFFSGVADRTLIMAALDKDIGAYNYLDDDLRRDPEISLKAAQSFDGLWTARPGGHVFDVVAYMQRQKYMADRDFMAARAKEDPRFIGFAAQTADSEYLRGLTDHYAAAGRLAELAPYKRHLPQFWGGDLPYMLRPLAAFNKAAAPPPKAVQKLSPPQGPEQPAPL